MNKEKILEINNLTLGYNCSEAVVKNINLCVHKGEIVCIVGESGVGKSTLINSILNLQNGIEVIDGNVTFLNENIFEMSKKRLREIRGANIGIIYQEPYASLNPIRKISSQFYDTLKAHKNISKKDALEKTKKLLDKMNFEDTQRIMDSYPVQLSGGMNQRVAIALAMCLSPSILLADEPTSDLDVLAKKQILDELIKLQDEFETGMLIITHDMYVASRIADMIAVMHLGRIVECGSRDSVLKSPTHPYTKALINSIPKISVGDY